MRKSGICSKNLPHPDMLCLPGLSVVSAGHPRHAVHPHRSDAGAGAPVHHPALCLRGGHPHASVRLRGRLRPGHALRPASQQPPVCLLGDRMPERAAVHRHPEAGLPPSADGRDVHVPSAVRPVPSSRGRHFHPGLQDVQEESPAQTWPHGGQRGHNISEVSRRWGLWHILWCRDSEWPKHHHVGSLSPRSNSCLVCKGSRIRDQGGLRREIRMFITDLTAGKKKKKGAWCHKLLHSTHVYMGWKTSWCFKPLLCYL